MEHGTKTLNAAFVIMISLGSVVKVSHMVWTLEPKLLGVFTFGLFAVKYSCGISGIFSGIYFSTELIHTFRAMHP